MNETTSCPQCESAIDGDSPLGICPNCLLNMGFDSRDPQTSEFQGRFVAPTPEELAPLFPELEVLEVIGKGGMGVVYRAKQRDLDRVVALKILRPDVGEETTFAERFLREGRALAQLNHPNIIAVHNFGHREHLYFLVMEYVDGVDLRHLQQTTSLTPVETLALVPPICEALQYAHEQGVIHRDIKPENILLTQSGRIKIADFGLAKLAGTDEAFGLTATHQVMGTPHYMAPEQYEHPQDVDHRADIYSLGVVIYELLTGELPLGRFALPSDSNGIDVRLDEVVIRSLEKKPERRFQRASEFQTAVEELSRTPAPTVPPVPPTEENWVTDIVDRVRAIKWRQLAEKSVHSVKTTTGKIVKNRREIAAQAACAASRGWRSLQSLYVGRVMVALAVWSLIVAISVIIGVVTLAPPFAHIADHTAERVVSRNNSFDFMRVVITRDAELPRLVVLPSTEFVRTASLELSGPKEDGISRFAMLRVVFDGQNREAQIQGTGQFHPSIPWTPDAILQWMTEAGVDVDAPHSKAEREAIWDFVNTINNEPTGVQKIGDIPFRRDADHVIDSKFFDVVDQRRRHRRTRYGLGVDDEVVACISIVTWAHGALILVAIPFFFWWNRSGTDSKPTDNAARVATLVAWPVRALSLSSLLGAAILLFVAMMLSRFDLGRELKIESASSIVTGAVAIAVIGFVIGVTCYYIALRQNFVGRLLGIGCASVSLFVPVLNLLTFPYAFWTLLSLNSKSLREGEL